MKLWNRHISLFSIVPDKHMNQCCVDFASKHAADIHRLNIRNNFALHLVNLFNWNLIHPLIIRRCLSILEQGCDPQTTSPPVISMVLGETS